MQLEGAGAKQFVAGAAYDVGEDDLGVGGEGGEVGKFVGFDNDHDCCCAREFLRVLSMIMITRRPRIHYLLFRQRNLGLFTKWDFNDSLKGMLLPVFFVARPLKF